MRGRWKAAARWMLLAALLCTPWRAGIAALQQPPPDPNTLTGIGAVLGFHGIFPIVRDVVKGGPADLDGRLKIGDSIAGVAQGNSDFVDCTNLTLEEVVAMIRGRIGATVRIQVIPGGGVDPAKREVITLTRAEIKLGPDGVPLQGPAVVLNGAPMLGVFNAAPPVVAPVPALGVAPVAPVPAAPAPAAPAPRMAAAPAAAATPAPSPTPAAPDEDADELYGIGARLEPDGD